MNLSKSFLLSCFFISQCLAQEDVGWTLQKSKDSIDVYSRLSPNSNYKSIKVITTFHSTLPAMVGLITDADSHYKWINNCTQSKLLTAVGDSNVIFCEYYNLPWPVSDRDVVIQTKIKYNVAKTSVTLTSRGNAGYIPIKDNVVRIPEFEGSWKLSLQPNGTISGEYIATVNPGGYLPAWLVNMFVTNGPYDSFVNMKKILATQ